VSVRLLESLATTEELAAAFGDEAVLEGMLRFEAALARAQAPTGLAPASTAEAIASVSAGMFDRAAIVQGARDSGTIAIAFVSALTARVKATDPAAADAVHRGATSQDLTDTALALCLRTAGAILTRDHQRLSRALRFLSERHRDTVMLARTLLQPAAPTTFGLKAAQWYAGIAHAHEGVSRAFADAAVLQLGGPVGTLAAFGEHGDNIARAMAAELDLAWPGVPWHTERGRFAALAGACATYMGALAKIARDVALLMQAEVSEASEPGGGSSSMPHKRNPAGCAVILAAAARVPGLASSCFSGLANEHERGVGGWHAEALTISEIVQTTGSALAAAANLAEHLSVDEDRMRRNLETFRGVVFPEGGRPEDCLGSAELFRRRLLGDDKR
jgi:3-carboxy-cis,cis-muconate cycloisomerase